MATQFLDFTINLELIVLRDLKCEFFCSKLAKEL